MAANWRLAGITLSDRFLTLHPNYIEDIPDDQLGYIVTEDFLAPIKGVPLVQRLYHDIFANLDAAQNYAESLKRNRQKTSLQPWYQREMEAIRLMEKTGQTYLDKSFCIFTKNHIESLKKLPARENVAC